MIKTSKPTIFFSAGGTGGHIFPALAVARLFLDEYNVVWIGTSTGLENEIVPKNNIMLETIKISGLRRKSIAKMLMMPFKLIYAFFQAMKLIQKYRPQVIVGFGGYATFPICLIGRIFRIPVLIHEQNAIPGLSNKILAKFATKVMVAFDGVIPSSKTIVVGNPVRSEILSIDVPETRYTNKNSGLNILIVGGSLGAKVFNELLPDVMAKVKNVANITHQVGRGDKSLVEGAYKKHGVHVNVVNFIDDMANAYTKADLVICRAGASTVSEVAAVGIAAIFVPYPYAVDDHQYYNAKYLVDAGAAQVIKQRDLTEDGLADVINHLDKNSCHTMAINGRKVAKPNSSDDIYQLVTTQLIQR